MLFGAILHHPGLGADLVAGPLVAWIVGALERRRRVGGLSALRRGVVQHWHPQGQRRPV